MGRFQIRALLTPLVERLTSGEKIQCPPFERQTMENAWIKSDLEAFPLTAGQVAGLAWGITSVRDVIEDTTRSDDNED